MKCTNSHEMAEAAKFCGECGQAPAADIQKCTGCQAELPFLKGNTLPKFCGECGVAVATAGADDQALDQELEALNAFTKARTEIEKDLEVLPVVDEGEIDVGPINELLKSATVKDPETGVEGIEAAPIVGELLKSVNVLSAQVRMNAEHAARWTRHLADENARILKSLGVLVGANKRLHDELGRIGGESRGRRGVTAVVHQPTRGTNGSAEMPDLGPGELFTKAIVANQAKGGTLFDSTTIGQLEHWCGMGAGLRQIAEQDPALALKLRAGITAS
jgi:hypothetical protein